MMRYIGTLAAAISVVGTGVAAAWDIALAPNGSASLTHEGKPVAELTPGLFCKGWRGARVGAAAAYPDDDTVPRRSAIVTPDGGTVDCEVSASADAGTVTLHYRMTPRNDVELNSLHVSIDLPESVLAGAAYTMDGDVGTFPMVRAATHVHASADARSLQLTWPDGRSLALDLAAPTPILLQDNRQWGPNFSIRVGPQMDASEVWPTGKTLELVMAFSSTAGVHLELERPMTMEAGNEWIPLTAELDIEPGSALDFSEFRPTGSPAGDHGRVVAAEGGVFAFEDSPVVPRRFYGVNLCFTAQYLPRDEASRLAERLMRLGYNAVRFHHYEGTLVDRSGGTSTGMKTDVFDQFDGLFSELKKRGIYATTDLYVSRPVFAAEIWPGATGDVAMDEFKMLVPVNEAAYQNLMAWTRNFMTHRNPYTGMTYAADPTLAWISLINEGNEGNFIQRLSARAKAEWLKAWNAWLTEIHGDTAALAAAWGEDTAGTLEQGTVPLPGSFTDDTAKSRDFAVFIATVEQRFFARVKTAIRDELGSAVLLTNLNAWTNTKQCQVLRTAYDYVDDHFYVDHPEFIEQPWRLPSRCANASPVASGAVGGRHTAFTRLLDKPFTISEYNYSGPGRYRGVGGILTGCMAALQEWSILWRFAYSHSRSNLFEVSTAGYFDLATDPLNQAAERASLCLFLRGDMGPAGRTLAITMNPDVLMSREGPQGGIAPPWSPLVLTAKVGTFVAAEGSHVPADVALPVTAQAPTTTAGMDTDPFTAGAGEAIVKDLRDRGWLGAGNITDLNSHRVQSASGELTVDGPADTMILDTPRTAGCFAPAGRAVETHAARFSVLDTDATVWVSSLDGKPLTVSKHLLITHLTDLQNTGARYAESARRTLLAWGHTPHLVRQGRAEVMLKRHAEGVSVWALSTGGKRLEKLALPPQADNLVLELNVNGPHGARMIYEVVLD